MSAPNDGWIPWSGGPCPVEPNALIEVRLRKGRKYEGRACGFAKERWLHSLSLPEGGHIIAYRVVKP